MAISFCSDPDRAPRVDPDPLAFDQDATFVISLQAFGGPQQGLLTFKILGKNDIFFVVDGKKVRTLEATQDLNGEDDCEAADPIPFVVQGKKPVRLVTIEIILKSQGREEGRDFVSFRM
jgi:hypothetical protein